MENIMKKSSIAMSALLASLAWHSASGQTPELLGIGPESQALGSGRIPSIAVDSRGQPHIVADGGSMIYLYDKIGDQWRALVKDAARLVNAPQFYNPAIEIDSKDRAWISGVTWAPAGGIGVIVRDNISLNPSDFGSFPLSRAGARYPVGLLSIDPAFPDQAIVMGSSGGWQRAIRENGSTRLADSGNLPFGDGGEKTAFWISKAGSVAHADGSVRAVWHGAMGGYYGDYSAYINSLMHARGERRIVWANYPNYPTMKDDGSYVRVVSDNLDPEVAYITCDFSAGGKHAGAGIGMNIYNGSGMNFAPNNILFLDRAGTAGIRRLGPQSTPAKDGGVFVVWARGGRVKMRFVPPTARSINDCGPEWDLAAGGPAAVTTDEDGNLHLAYTRGGQVFYRLIEVSSSAKPEMLMAVDFDGDGRHDPAEFDASGQELRVAPGLVGGTVTISMPFTQRGDIPVFGDYDGNPANGVEVAIYRPSDSLWQIYNGDEFSGYDAGKLVSFVFGTTDDAPFAGDFDGDGFADVGLLRRATMTWFIRNGIGSAYTGPSDFTWGPTNALLLPGKWVDRVRDSLVIWNPTEKKYSVYNETFLNGADNFQMGDVFGDDYPVPADFNGDGVLDLSIFRPASSEWFSTGFEGARQMGGPDDVPAPGKYTYDARADLAIIRGGKEWYIRPSETGLPDPFGSAPIMYGGADHVPAAADFDGDGAADLVAFDRATAVWNIRGLGSYIFGAPGDLPVPAYWDDDEFADFGIFRPSTASWFMWGTSVGALGGPDAVFGAPADKPVPGDFDGDGITELAVYRNGEWFVDGMMPFAYGNEQWTPFTWRDSDSGIAGFGIFNPITTEWGIPGLNSITWGPAGAKPVPADYDGDGTVDYAVFDRGFWWIQVGDNLLHDVGPFVMTGTGSAVGALAP